MVCVGGASVMKSGSGERESVVEDDWSEGREDELEERDVAGGERFTSLGGRAADSLAAVVGAVCGRVVGTGGASRAEVASWCSSSR